LPAKNTLGLADAQCVETAFAEKIAALDREQAEQQVGIAETGDGASQDSDDAKAVIQLPANPTRSPRRRASVKIVRLRDKDHRKFVSTQPCLVCGRTPVDPHHLRFPNLARSAEKSATNSPSRCAVCIIGNCTTMAMKNCGGRASISTRCQ
jgi:hypothetical protein